MSDAPVERHHREWALRAMGESPDPGVRVNDDEPLEAKDLEEAYHWLDTGEFPEDALAEANDDDLEVMKIAVTIAQAFSNFEFEIRTETDAALKESREHAQALDANWHQFSRISMDAIRAALGLPAEAGVQDAVLKIQKLMALEDLHAIKDTISFG